MPHPVTDSLIIDRRERSFPALSAGSVLMLHTGHYPAPRSSQIKRNYALDKLNPRTWERIILPTQWGVWRRLLTVRYLIDKEHHFVLTVGEGSVTYREIRDHQDRLLRDPDFRRQIQPVDRCDDRTPIRHVC